MVGKTRLATGRKIVLIVLGLAAAVYVIACALLYSYQERLIFYPEVTAADFEYRFTHPHDEVELQVEGATIHALHFKVDRPRGAVLYLHGNAGSLTSWGSIATAFLKRDYDVLIPDYRGYGKSTGTVTSERTLLGDATVAYEYLQRHHAEDRIIVYGRSLGTGIATYLAATKRPKMLLLESAYFSLRDLARRQFPYLPPMLLKYPLRTDLWIADVSCPVHLFHGTRDEVIPYESSERLLGRIRSEHELFAIQGGGHNNLAEFAPYDQKLGEILR